MQVLPFNIKEIFFSTLHGELGLPEFEYWLYKSDQPEKYLSEDIYNELIAFNYKQTSAHYELTKLLDRIIDKSEYETWRLNRLISQTLEKAGDYPKVITMFYDLYCKGYYFLDNLAFGYGLPLDCPWSEYGLQSFSDLSKEQQMALADKFYPQIKSELKKVADWLSSGKIVLTGEIDPDLGRFQYTDNRSEQEKKKTTYKKEDQ